MVKKILPLLHVRDLSNTKEPSDVTSLVWITAEVKEKKMQMNKDSSLKEVK